jgi:hypothetical protein
VANAAGHAVFASIGTNLLVASTEGGYGLAVDHATGDKTYMKVRGGGLGIGVGSKETRQVYIFNTKAAYDRFVAASGKWTFGADAGAVAKFGDQGNGSAAVSKSGVQVYTIAKNGVSLAASFGPSRFYRDRTLNPPVDGPMNNPGTETVVDANGEPCPEEDQTDAEAKATPEAKPEQKPEEKSADTAPGQDYQ